MEIILPEQNIMNVESIIFKEGTNFNLDPDINEYYIAMAFAVAIFFYFQRNSK